MNEPKMTEVFLYNTKTRTKELLTPISAPHVKMYTCGPTVYDYAHIGNLRSFMFADVLRRVLEYAGYQVEQVQNITDVGHLTGDTDDTGEDKMEKGSRREGKTAWEVAEFYTQAFFQDMKRMNIQPPHVQCKATDHIEEQIDLIKILEEKGFTYEIVGDGIYYDTSKFPAYADFARLDLEHLRSGARVEENTAKRNITDFALWKFSRSDEKRQMEWKSPWGVGFPGWHIECSAMSMKYLGDRFDIHTGGIDHIPVHHTNEIAQNNAAVGHDVVSVWMHNEFVVTPKGEKMAKSSENFSTLNGLVQQGFDPLAYRYYLLNTHYRTPIAFSEEGLRSATEGLLKLRNFIVALTQKTSQSNAEVDAMLLRVKHDFEQAIFDDLNIPKALGIVFSMIHELNKLNDQGVAFPCDAVLNMIRSFDVVFGLNLFARGEDEKIPQAVHELVGQRKKAREENNWALSDELRDKIADYGFTVEDTKEGQRIMKNTK